MALAMRSRGQPLLVCGIWYTRTSRLHESSSATFSAVRVRVAWVVLVVAGLLEVGFAVALKASDGFSRLWPTVLFVVCAVGSFGLLNVSLKTLPIGTAYAVWTGIGAVGTAMLGMLVLGESASAARLACIGLIVAGVIGLQVTGGH
jgi:quaternary ammonium compound-resistance protein SugE